ncbi:MAG: putative ABC transporter permease [Eubacteriales bacterium]
MKFKKFCSLCMIAVIVSFGGFWVENIFIGFSLGYIDNRNMFLPFLLGYGMGVVALYLLFGTPEEPKLFGFGVDLGHRAANILLYFVIAFFCVTGAEITLGTLVEEYFHITWWEYTTLPLNMTKFSCVPISAAYGALVTAFMGLCFKPLYRMMMKPDVRVLAPVALVMIVILIADMTHSAIVMYETSDFVEYWRIDL